MALSLILSAHAGYMLHSKCLYVAIAQRKEVRRMYLQARFSQTIPSPYGRGGDSIQCGYHAMYYPLTSGVVSHFPQPQGTTYSHNFGLGPAVWRSSSGLATPQRCGFQHMPIVG